MLESEPVDERAESAGRRAGDSSLLLDPDDDRSGKVGLVCGLCDCCWGSSLIDKRSERVEPLVRQAKVGSAVGWDLLSISSVYVSAPLWYCAG